MNDDNLPTTIHDSILDNPPSLTDDLTSTATLSQAKHSDIQIANDMLRIAYDCISKVTTVSGACKLIDTTMNVVEKRRKILCLEYGYQGKGTQGSLTEPLPD